MFILQSDSSDAFDRNIVAELKELNATLKVIATALQTIAVNTTKPPITGIVVEHPPHPPQP